MLLKALELKRKVNGGGVGRPASTLFDRHLFSFLSDRRVIKLFKLRGFRGT